jgi:hypothetical protein
MRGIRLLWGNLQFDIERRKGYSSLSVNKRADSVFIALRIFAKFLSSELLKESCIPWISFAKYYRSLINIMLRRLRILLFNLFNTWLANNIQQPSKNNGGVYNEHDQLAG